MKMAKIDKFPSDSFNESDQFPPEIRERVNVKINNWHNILPYNCGCSFRFEVWQVAEIRGENKDTIL